MNRDMVLGAMAGLAVGALLGSPGGRDFMNNVMQGAARALGAAGTAGGGTNQQNGLPANEAQDSLQGGEKAAQGA